jgi:adenylate kinase family enzyme
VLFGCTRTSTADQNLAHQIDALRRVVVVGCGGSGKTVLARELGSLFGLPVIHLDDVFYDEAWNPMPARDFEAAQHALVAEPEWVIGNYASTPLRLAAADTVILLDVSTLVALRGVLSRWWRYRGGHHSDGVHVRVTGDFLRYVIGYRSKVRPRVLAAIAQHAPSAQVWMPGSRRAVRRMLWKVAAAASAAQD